MSAGTPSLWWLNGALLADARGSPYWCPGCPCPGGSGGGGHLGPCGIGTFPSLLWLTFFHDNFQECGPLCGGLDANRGAPSLPLTYTPSLGTWITPLVATGNNAYTDPCHLSYVATFELTCCLGSLDSVLWPSGCQNGLLVRCYDYQGHPAGTDQECLTFPCHYYPEFGGGQVADACFSDPAAPCYTPANAHILFMLNDRYPLGCGLCRGGFTVSYNRLR